MSESRLPLRTRKLLFAVEQYVKSNSKASGYGFVAASPSSPRKLSLRRAHKRGGELLDRLHAGPRVPNTADAGLCPWQRHFPPPAGLPNIGAARRDWPCCSGKSAGRLYESQKVRWAKHRRRDGFCHRGGRRLRGTRPFPGVAGRVRKRFSVPEIRARLNSPLDGIPWCTARKTPRRAHQSPVAID